ncbi:hypothetical protein [Aliikangiella sp. G2MR2-5]|uniref:fascin domain-containing protein n=1 Tax=Aliikangiella sp. G2MR2-5 TaxID=2788943 RepID=UPI0018AC84E9|nr:hypothetical protein [Aliikangiella sp. G2MR2-5]
MSFYRYVHKGALVMVALSINLSNAWAGSGGGTVNSTPTEFSLVSLYSPNSKSFFSFKDLGRTSEGDDYFGLWTKKHTYHNSTYYPYHSDESIIFELVDDNDNNNCISNNDTVAISDPTTGAYLGGYNHGYFNSNQHVIQHKLFKNPEKVPTYKIFNLSGGCLNRNGMQTFQLASTVDLIKKYFWNNTEYAKKAIGEVLSDKFGNKSFQIKSMGAVTNQLAIEHLHSAAHNTPVALVSYQSTFISGDGKAYLPTINGASEKWEILAVNQFQALRHYCIPDGTKVRLKNSGNKKFLVQTGWTFGMNETGTEFEMKNRSYEGACIDEKDAFSLMLPNGDFVQTNPGHHNMDHHQPFIHKTMTFAYVKNPDLDLRVNKANLTFEIDINGGGYGLPKHEDNTMSVDGNGNRAFPFSKDALASHPAGVAVQYSFHSDSNSFCDNSSFFLKRSGSQNEHKFFGATTEGALSAAKIRTDRPHVLAWESFRFVFEGDDNDACYTPNQLENTWVNSTGSLVGTPYYKNLTRGGNLMRMWDPEGGSLGFFDTYFYPFGADSFIQVTEPPVDLGNFDGSILGDLVNTDPLVGLRYYFGPPEVGQNYATELSVTGLQAHDARYLGNVNAGGERAIAQSEMLHNWEFMTFEPVNRTLSQCIRGGDKVYIRTYNGHRLQAHQFDNVVDSDTYNRLTWETFTIKKLNGNANSCIRHGDTLQLDTYHGTHLRAVDGYVIHDSEYNENNDHQFKLLLNNFAPQ